MIIRIINRWMNRKPGRIPNIGGETLLRRRDDVFVPPPIETALIPPPPPPRRGTTINVAVKDFWRILQNS